MEKKFLFFRLLTGFVMLGSIIMLSGCMMAIPLMMAANAGIMAHSVTKTVQMSTDGGVEMAIGENEVPTQNKLVLTKISKLAIWPDDGMVVVADELQKSGVFTLIATPSKVGNVLGKSGFNQNINGLTRKEKAEAFLKVCKETGTEAVVVFESLGSETNTRMWSFSRASMDFKGKIIIFELQSNKIIFKSITEMSISLGGSSPNQKEIMAKAGKMLAQRIIELKQGQIVAQK
jgi:hypothetical protein